MEQFSVISEADILAEIVDPNQPTLSPEQAHAVLALQFNDSAKERIRDLLSKNNAGSITPVEKANLERYVRVGQFLDLIQAKARLSLQPVRSAS